MSNRNAWNVAQICTGIGITLMAGLFSSANADDKKVIPDHSGFQSCQPCHAEKHDMWEASGHGKAIGLTAVNRQAATETCHSSRSVEAKQQDSKADSASKERYHQVSCLACHSLQKTEFDHQVAVDPEQVCEVCHTQRPIFWGKGAKGIEDSRNFHSGVPCVSCHMTEGNHAMKVLRPDDPGLTEKRLDTCTACHQDNNREARVEQIQEWQSTYDENIKPLLADVKEVEEALKKNPALLDAALKSKLEDVKANLSLLEKDGSRGFHNLVFSLEIASLASEALKEIKAAIK